MIFGGSGGSAVERARAGSERPGGAAPHPQVSKLALDRAPELLAPLLSDRDLAIRAEVVTGLFRYRFLLWLRSSGKLPSPLPLPVLERMLPLARDRDLEVRRALAYGFVRFRDERALGTVTALSGDADEWTRLYSVQALARIADPSAADAIVERLSDPSPRVRRAAVLAAAAVGRAEAAAPLRDDPDLHVRAAVAGVLSVAADLPGGDVPGWLRTLAGDRSTEVRSAAVASLAGRLKEGAYDDLRTALRDPSEYVRAAAVGALASLPAAERASLLAVVLGDTALAVRCAVVGLLAGEPGPDAFARIEAELSSDQVDVRGAAIAALARRKEPAALDLAWGAFCDSPGMSLTALRETAVETFAAFDSEKSDGHLREALGDPSYPVAMAAYRVLASRGAPGVTPPEETITLSPHRDLAVPEYPVLTLVTTKGPITMVLFRDLAPVHVANAVGLVREGFFDGKTWLRVVPNFVIQGGAPSPLGSEGQEWLLRAEVNRARFGRGAVGMSRGDLFNSGDSQFFVDHVPAAHLDGQYTRFGQVVSGLSTLDRIEAGDLILRAWVGWHWR